MRWKKIGKIFEPDGKSEWMKTHATLPIVVPIQNRLYKIYFSSRDAYNRSHVGWLIIDVFDPLKIVDMCNHPVLSPGELGTFDEAGSMASSLLNIGDKIYMYYIGVNLAHSVPFRNSIGLAISEDNGNTFKKFSSGPIIDRSYHDPCFVATPYVLEDAGLYKIWYLSCNQWIMDSGKPKHFYNIKYAESNNGIDWHSKGKVAIDFKNKDEYAISSPRVIKENGIYKMWYSYRGDSYRIGYAESNDGKDWERKDHLIELPTSCGEWDSEMVEYPFIFNYQDRRFMIYNGNGYGRTGLGIAELES